MDQLEEKLKRLKADLQQLGSVAVAFSSGVDSTFLLKVAHDTLGDRAIAITATSAIFPARESSEAAAFCKSEAIRQLIVPIDELAVEGFCENPPNRCYLCKRNLMGQIVEKANAEGIAHVAEGTNVDDEGDYRPGMQAIKELGILSPLRKAGLTKAEIRELSKRMHLPTWEKPSYACLASRFPYGEQIDAQKLSMVEQAEQLLLDLGFQQMRVRIHGSIARIEVLPKDFAHLMETAIREEILARFTEFGFTYVTLDLKGFRSGSMNEVLPKN